MSAQDMCSDRSDDRLAWIEPAIDQLNVDETATGRNRGGDGNRLYADCTRS